MFFFFKDTGTHREYLLRQPPSPTQPSSDVHLPILVPVGCDRARVPSVKLARPSAFSPGWVVMMLIAPPIELRPYRVPCGPRSTSTRLMLARLQFCPTWRPRYTPST